MSKINPDHRSAYLNLSDLFVSGRISGWVERNSQALHEGDINALELDKLEALNLGFADQTRSLSPEGKLMMIKDALSRADQNPLSATRLKI